MAYWLCIANLAFLIEDKHILLFTLFEMKSCVIKNLVWASEGTLSLNFFFIVVKWKVITNVKYLKIIDTNQKKRILFLISSLKPFTNLSVIYDSHKMVSWTIMWVTEMIVILFFATVISLFLLLWNRSYFHSLRDKTQKHTNQTNKNTRKPGRMPETDG